MCCVAASFDLLGTVTFSGVMAIQHVTRGETVFPPPFLSSDVCVSVWISMVATEKTSKPWEPSPYYTGGGLRSL